MWSCVVVLGGCLLSLSAGVPTPGRSYTDEGARRLVQFDRHSGDCKLFGDSRIVEEILRELAESDAPAAVLEATELTAIISQCSKRDAQERGSPSLPKDFPHIIYPGTKWCGAGNAAESLEDLGTLRGLDTCCRDHDLCPDDILSGETKNNVTNDTPFTISHCDCDEKLRDCLRKDNTVESNQVGMAFFSSGLFRCYSIAHPIVRCNSWAGLLAQACQNYTFDMNGEAKPKLLDLKIF